MLRSVVILAAAWLLSQSALAQTTTAATLPGARVAASTATTASFSLGLSKSDGASFETSALTTDSIRLIGTIQPEAAQVGQKADIYVVAALGNTFFMRNANGAFVPWNFQIPSLVPFRSQETLSANHAVDFLTGQIPIAGTFQLFLGYKAADGVLIYTRVPHVVSITAPVVQPPTKTVREQATEAYAANISTLVQSNPACIACHITGGVASTTALRFVGTGNANHLSLNFTQFENLVKSRGRTYILTTVLGGNEHAKPAAGGALFRSTDQGYRNLDSFLQLLEKL